MSGWSFSSSSSSSPSVYVPCSPICSAFISTSEQAHSPSIQNEMLGAFLAIHTGVYLLHSLPIHGNGQVISLMRKGCNFDPLTPALTCLAHAHTHACPSKMHPLQFLPPFLTLSNQRSWWWTTFWNEWKKHRISSCSSHHCVSALSNKFATAVWNATISFISSSQVAEMIKRKSVKALLLQVGRIWNSGLESGLTCIRHIHSVYTGCTVYRVHYIQGVRAGVGVFLEY